MKTSFLIKNVLTYGVGQILMRCLSLILLPFFTSYLTVQDYGIISLLNLLATFAVSLLTLGIGTAFCICYANVSLNKSSIVMTSFFMILIFALAALIPFGLWSSEISTYFFFSNSFADVVFLTYLTAAFSSLTTPFSLYLQFTHQATTVTVISVIFTLVAMFLNVIGIALFDMGIRGQVWATFISTALLFLLYWIPVQKKIKWEIPNFFISKELLKYGLPMIPASFALFFLQNSQRYFLDRYSTLTELGLYAVGFNIASVINLLVSAFSQAWTPYFVEYQNKQNEAKILFGKIITYYTYFFGILALAFFVFANPVIALMATPPFQDSAKIIGIIATGWILLGYYNLMNPGIVFAKKVYFNSIIQFVAVAFAWLGNAWMIPAFGMSGAALVFLGSHLMMLLIEEMYNITCGFFRASLEWSRIFSFGTVIIGLIVITYALSPSSLEGQILWGCCAICFALIWCFFNLIPDKMTLTP